MRCLIVGTAKSGTTALLYAIAQAQGEGSAIHVEERIACLRQLAPQAAVKLIFEHEGGRAIAEFGARFERRVLLVRDPRDNLISRLLYMIAANRHLLADPAYLRVFSMLLQRKQQAPATVALRQLPPLTGPAPFLGDYLRANQELADFAAAQRGNWFILRYEDLVAGRLEALSAYLGLPLAADAPLDPAYGRVARTRGAGDWRHWFTADDVNHYRDRIAPLLAALDYADDWTLAAAPHIEAAHSWQYFARLVAERRAFYGLPPFDLPTPDQHGPETRLRISKGDIINRLIRQFGFTSYLEYNKFDGATYYDDIVCASKTRAFLPEHSYLDAVNAERLLRLAGEAALQDILPLPQLLERIGPQRFDVIFFDPVHVRPDVDHALRALAGLLSPGGVLVVHDCHPERAEQTSVTRRRGAWVGQTYVAFALLRHYNRAQALTITEDFGVGLVWNRGLFLDYALDADLPYPRYAAQAAEFSGLTSYQEFLEKTASADIADLFAQAAPTAPATFVARMAPVHAECQLFWCGPHGQFAEAASASQAVTLDGSLQCLDFVLPPHAGPVARLRFDFADCRAAIALASMELCTPGGALAWRWEDSGPTDPAWRNARHCAASVPAPARFILATSDDPQYHPALPAVLDGRVGAGWTWRVSFAPQAPLVSALLNELADLRAALTGGKEAP